MKYLTGRTALLRAAGGLALTIPHIANAQAQAFPPEPRALPTSEVSDTTTTGIQDIVVTAQRRSESIQKSSLQISAVTGDTLSKAGVTQPQDLSTVATGLQIGLSGTVAQPYIRGVGNQDNTGLATSGVAFNLDGVYIGQPNGYGVPLFDLERVEVVKGPQGTLYGRNATGGAINIITKQPGPDFGGNIGVDVNNYGLARLDGAVNVPLTDDIAIRTAFYLDRRDSYYRDGTGDDKSEGVRVRAKVRPTSDLTLLLNFEYEHVGGAGPGKALNLGPRYNLPNPREGLQGPGSINFLTTSTTAPRPFEDLNIYSVGGQLDWQSGDWTFTLLPNYRSVSESARTYANGYKLEFSERV